MTTTVANAHSTGTVVKPVTATVRRAFFWPYTAFSVLCFISLYAFSAKTDTKFAVVLGSPLSAAAIGAGFAAAVVMFASTIAENDWTSARGTVFAPMALLTPMLVITLTSWNRLRFDHAPGLVEAFTWIWAAAFIASPVLGAAVWLAQNRRPATDPPGTAPMGPDVSIPTAVMGVVLTGLAVALWTAPGPMGRHWAWTLTPFDARVLGAWFFAFGAGAFQAIWERDLHRMRAGFLTDVTLAVLSLAALARYHSEVRWSAPLTWVYLVILVGLIAAGLSGRYLALPEALARGRGEDPHAH